jgi:hypothetical protein
LLASGKSSASDSTLGGCTRSGRDFGGSAAAVPEPTTLLLALLGLAAFGCLSRRKQVFFGKQHFGPLLEVMTMIRQRIPSLLIFTTALLFLVTLNFNDRPASFASQPAANSSNDKDAVAGQIKELQKQVAELQSQVSDLKTPRIIAAGTATIKLGAKQDNRTSIRVKLRGDVVARLGGNCIVQLTNRYPTGGSFFVAYWKPAADGFDILLADPSLVGVGINPNRNEPYYVDWIVVQE